MKHINKTSLIQFIKFSIVGVSNTLISLAIYYVFLWINPALYLLGNILGWIVSVANSFLWNYLFVFHSEFKGFINLGKKLCKTYISYASTFILSTVLLYIEVEILFLSAIICPIINLGITIPLNFILNKFWAFR